MDINGADGPQTLIRSAYYGKGYDDVECSRFRLRFAWGIRRSGRELKSCT